MHFHLCFTTSAIPCFVPTRCVAGVTVQSCHVSFCATTAVWERSLGSTSCFLVVSQRIPFLSHLDSFSVDETMQHCFQPYPDLWKLLHLSQWLPPSETRSENTSKHRLDTVASIGHRDTCTQSRNRTSTVKLVRVPIIHSGSGAVLVHRQWERHGNCWANAGGTSATSSADSSYRGAWNAAAIRIRPSSDSWAREKHADSVYGSNANESWRHTGRYEGDRTTLYFERNLRPGFRWMDPQSADVHACKVRRCHPDCSNLGSTTAKDVCQDLRSFAEGPALYPGSPSLEKVQTRRNGSTRSTISL